MKIIVYLMNHLVYLKPGSSLQQTAIWKHVVGQHATLFHHNKMEEMSFLFKLHGAELVVED